MKTEVTFHFLLCLLITAISATAAELPVIEMPKYIIEGVEQATSLLGSRISSEALAKAALPDTPPHDRPALPLDILATLVERPGMFNAPGNGRTSVEVISGGFGKAAGWFDSMEETDFSGVKLAGNIERPPRRTSYGPKLSTLLKGSGVRWFGIETTFSPSLEFISNSFTSKSLTDKNNNNLTGIGLRGSITPTALFGGRIFGDFEYNYTDLDNLRKLSASHDRIILDYSHEIPRGWLASRLDFQAETVSADKTGHSLLSFESIYFRQYNESIQWRAGLLGYTGKAIRIPVISAPGISESRMGAVILAGLSWRVSPDNIIEFDLTPRPRFESFRETFYDHMELDSTARGVTVELPVAMEMTYRKAITGHSTIDASISHAVERHRPFRSEATNLNWSIETRRTEITTGSIEFYMEPKSNWGVTIFGHATAASSNGFSAGSNAPFISPLKFGADFVLQSGNLMFDNTITWQDGAPIDFNGDDKSPAFTNWNSSLHWRVRPGLTGKIGIDNLLNQNRWEIPGYMLPPLTIWAGIEWRGNNAVW